VIRFLSSLFVALALLLAPATMAAGSAPATAAAPAAGMNHDGHCGGEAPADENKAPVHMSCASSCAAVPAADPGAPLSAPLPPRDLLTRALFAPLAGAAPESETPPPRSPLENRI
jgi:hypothetical protein